jgi:sulfatase modifying factor 1
MEPVGCSVFGGYTIRTEHFIVLVLAGAIGGASFRAPHPAIAAEPAAQPKEVVNSIGMKLRLIPVGSFTMGTSKEEIDRLLKAFPGLRGEWFEDECPAHQVRITRPFYLGAYEVTVGQFRKFVADAGYKTDAEKDGKGGYGWTETVGKVEQEPKYTWRNPGFAQTDEHPVVNVSWNDAVAFCKWLRQKEGQTYRLPTEAEWEYACRAGTTTWYSCGDDPEMLATVGNVADATAKEKLSKLQALSYIAARDGYVFTAPVGRFQPNDFGLYDMHGNVWEYCADRYAAWYYAVSPADDPSGASVGAGRVFRGGGWDFGVWRCGAAYRRWIFAGRPRRFPGLSRAPKSVRSVGRTDHDRSGRRLERRPRAAVRSRSARRMGVHPAGSIGTSISRHPARAIAPSGTS